MPRPRATRSGRPVVADIAMFYGERSGGIRTYLNEKTRFSSSTDLFEHHVIVPGRRELHEEGLHQVRSLRLVASNGYRIPLGVTAVKRTLRALKPDYVLLHDPFWLPYGLTMVSHRLGAKVIAVHHASPALNAAAIPGPDALYLPFLRHLYRRAYRYVDAIMSAVDPLPDTGREAAIPLRFGLDEAFRPAEATRGDHLLYVGRLSREKRVEDLLDAAVLLERPVVIVGDGPARLALEARARGAAQVEFRPFVSDRHELAALYREAACVVHPGPHETFGLVVFEAAATGARVVACDSTPAVAASDGLIDTFTPGNVQDLARAITQALTREDTGSIAQALAERTSWPQVFENELHEFKKLD